MNYQSLFEETDIQDGGDNFRCLYYHQGGHTQLVCRSSYPMLFVLQGALEMRFKYDLYAIAAGNLTVIEAKALTQYCVAPDTIVLVYRPPLRLEMIFKQYILVSQTPISEGIPILPPLQVWIDRLLNEHVQGRVWCDDQAHDQRRELARIMTLEYPRRQLGELYAAFSACALGDCKKCHHEIISSTST